MEIAFYQSLLSEIKLTIQQTLYKAALAVNSELINMYWEIGNMIAGRQKQEGWSSAVIPRLASDLKNELPELKGFSERNLSYMLRFANEYSDKSILQQVVAKLPWGHNILLIEKIKDKNIRMWYARQTIENQWSSSVLEVQIQSNLFQKQGKAVSNFAETLPKPLSDLAQQTLKYPYIFDFLILSDTFREKDIENQHTARAFFF